MVIMCRVNGCQFFQFLQIYEITKILEEVGVYPNPPKVFNGRVLSFVPEMDFDQQFMEFYKLGMVSGNEHMATGFWLKYVQLSQVQSDPNATLFQFIQTLQMMKVKS